MDDNNENIIENQTISNTKSNYQPLSADDLASSSNNSKIFIIVGGIFTFILIFFLIFRYFSGKTNNNEQLSLTYWGLWEEKEVMQPLIDTYQATNTNVKINYIKMTPEDYKNKLIVRSQQGDGPDIYRFHNTWIPQIKEVLTPIPSNIMSNSEFEKTFYPIVNSDLEVGTHFFGLPLMLDGLVLMYNDTLLKSAGISESPKTWEDILNSISKLSVRDKEGNLVTSAIAIGTASNIEHYSDIFGLFLLQNGADIKNLTSEEAEGALESYRKFAEPPENFWDETMPSSIQSFALEKVAMILAPTWQIYNIKAINPNLNLKVTSVPRLPGGESISVASYWVEGVSRFSSAAKQQESWKFLKYLTEKETMTKLFELQIKARQYPTASPRVDLASIQSQNEYIGAIINQAKYFKSIPTISFTYDKGLNDEINQYIENAINSTINGESYSASLKTAKDGIDQVLKRYEN